MTVLLGLLLTSVVFALASAITGIESIHTDPRGTIITYWHGYGRLLALAYLLALHWHSTVFTGAIVSFGNSASYSGT